MVSKNDYAYRSGPKDSSANESEDSALKFESSEPDVESSERTPSETLTEQMSNADTPLTDGTDVERGIGGDDAN